jgi:hypothetical protein
LVCHGESNKDTQELVLGYIYILVR